jgi:hypothetical protein
MPSKIKDMMELMPTHFQKKQVQDLLHF